MSNDRTAIFEKFAVLREKYPEEIERIQADEQRLTKLMQVEELYAHPIMKDLLAVCHRDIITARKTLATDRTLDHDEYTALWAIIDARLWFVQLAARNYSAELDALDAELEQSLRAV